MVFQRTITKNKLKYFQEIAVILKYNLHYNSLYTLVYIYIYIYKLKINILNFYV